MAAFAQNLTLKKYGLSSGRVVYDVTQTLQQEGKVRTYRGKKTLLFDRYGDRERIEEEGSWSPGKTRVHTITQRVGTQVWIVDYSNHAILKSEMPGIDEIVRSTHGDLYHLSIKLLRQMGAHPDGNRTILGHPCRMWIMPQMRQCLDRGVPFLHERNSTVEERIERAIKIELNRPIPESAYKLPDFPTITLPHPKTPSPQTEKNPTTDKGKISLQKAKERLREKKRIFSDAHRCMRQSKNLQDINRCIAAFSKAMGEPFDPLEHYSEKERQAALRSIQEYLRSIDCALAAKSLEAIRRCRPDVTSLYR